MSDCSPCFSQGLSESFTIKLSFIIYYQCPKPGHSSPRMFYQGWLKSLDYFGDLSCCTRIYKPQYDGNFFFFWDCFSFTKILIFFSVITYNCFSFLFVLQVISAYYGIRSCNQLCNYLGLVLCSVCLPLKRNIWWKSILIPECITF